MFEGGVPDRVFDERGRAMLGKSLDESRENATLRVQQQGARSDVAPGEKGSVVKSHRGRAAVTGADRFLRKPLLTS